MFTNDVEIDGLSSATYRNEIFRSELNILHSYIQLGYNVQLVAVQVSYYTTENLHLKLV